MSLIFATQLTAVATSVLAAFAIVTAVYAIRAFGEQSKEVAILAQQNERDIAEPHQAQTARVFIGVDDTRPRYSNPYAKNGSDFPVYDAQIWRAHPSGLTAPVDFGMIPPGDRSALNAQVRYQYALSSVRISWYSEGIDIRDCRTRWSVGLLPPVLPAKWNG